MTHHDHFINSLHLRKTRPTKPITMWTNLAFWVDIYVIDKGVNNLADEFFNEAGQGRVINLFDFFSDKEYIDTAPNQGHGTLVACAIVGNKYGVAKSATLLNVKFEEQGKPIQSILNWRWTQSLSGIMKEKGKRIQRLDYQHGFRTRADHATGRPSGRGS